MKKQIKLNNYKITRESIETRKIVSTTEILAESEQKALDMILNKDTSYSNYDFNNSNTTRLSIADTYEVKKAQ